MRSEDVQDYVLKRPFEPFRLTLTDGRTYDVRHPEMAMVGFSSVIVGLPRPDKEPPVYDRAITISLAHIMQVESLETPSQSASSGG